MQDQASTLRRLVSRTATADGSGRARQIVVTGCKGGVGTTTLAINLAVSLRKFASRVLLVDANPARGDIAAMCGLKASRDIDDVLFARSSLEQATVDGPAGISILPRFGLPSSAPGAQSRQLVRQLDAVSRVFDFVVIDGGSCPLTAESLWPVADLATVVTTTDNVAITDAYVLIKSMVRNGIVPPVGIIVNQYRNKLLANDALRRLVDSCSRFLNYEVAFQDAVARDPKLSEAADSGRLVVCAYPSSSSANAILEVSRRIAEVDVRHCGLNSIAGN